MKNLTKAWLLTLAGTIVICIGAFFLFRENEPAAPVKVYQATPAPQPSQTATPAHHDAGPEHSHDTAGHSPHHHTADTPEGGDVDWRDDKAFRAPQEKEDPWKPLYPKETEVASSNGETDEPYPPRDWYKTEDPELRAEYLHAQLLKQFGDIPEVHIIGEFELNAARGITPTVDEYIAFLEAHNSLFPHESHRRTLEDIRKAVADGATIVFE